MKVTQIRQPQKCLSYDEIIHANAEYENGASTYELAEKYGCDRKVISGQLKKHGVNVTNNKITSALDREQVISLYASRLNAKQIAEKLNVKPKIIIKLLRANNTSIRSRWIIKLSAGHNFNIFCTQAIYTTQYNSAVDGSSPACTTATDVTFS